MRAVWEAEKGLKMLHSGFGETVGFATCVGRRTQEVEEQGGDEHEEAKSCEEIDPERVLGHLLYGALALLQLNN